MTDNDVDGPDETAWPHGPIANPVDRYAHLPIATRRYLEQLRDEYLASLQDAVRFYKTAIAVARFNKWLIVGIMGLLIGFASLGDTLKKLMGWMGK